MTRRACPTCERPIEALWDVPHVTVEKVTVVPLRERPLPEWMKPSERPARTRRQRALQEDLRYYWGEHQQRFAGAKQVFALDVVRHYVARLEKLAGRTVAWWALLPQWQDRKEIKRWLYATIPGAPDTRTRSSKRWVVGLLPRWRGDLRGCVQVELLHQARDFGDCAGTLARVWVRGHLNPRGGGP